MAVEIIKKEKPGGIEWICSECGESDYQGRVALDRNVPYRIPHRITCSAYEAPAPKKLPHELAEEDYRLGRKGDGNSDTL